MPKTDLHRKQQYKNYAILAVLIALVMIFFCIALLRFKV